MNNQNIAEFLSEQRDRAIGDFQTTPNAHPRFQETFAVLAGFDFVAYHQQLRSEILQNVVFWQKGGAVEANPLDAVLFEFNSIYECAVEARAYGIIDWQEPEMQVTGFEMGYNYSFLDEFEAVPGISLSFLQPIEDLLSPETIDGFIEPGQDMEEVPGFRSLVNAFLFSGLVAVHNVLAELDQRSTFAQLELKSKGLFLLGGHDTGLVYPILSKSAD